jgi:hypothetical protein
MTIKERILSSEQIKQQLSRFGFSLLTGETYLGKSLFVLISDQPQAFNVAVIENLEDYLDASFVNFYHYASEYNRVRYVFRWKE